MSLFLQAALALAVLVAVAAALFHRFVLRGPDCTCYDQPAYRAPASRSRPSQAHLNLVESFRADALLPRAGSRKEQLTSLRRALDERGEALEVDARIIPVEAADVAGEWVVSSEAEAGRRLLYLHGGGYMAGSPRSHRFVTSRLSAACRAQVLAASYRLMPEHSRRAGIRDCRKAYEWILAHGPDGASEPAAVVLAGDSAGANLALSTAQWLRDRGLRAPDALVALSPHTDSTFSGPSIRSNLDRDVLQGPSLRPMTQAPRWLNLWLGFLLLRVPPGHPEVSPLFGDLAGLPPTLIHASEAEVFLDDAVRYTNKAGAHGSEVTLQLWRHTLHAWHNFDTPEADEASSEIARFVEECVGPHARSDAP